MGRRGHTTRQVRRSFAWRSGAVFVVVGLLTHLMVQDVLRDNARSTLDFHAEFVVRTVVRPLLPDADDDVPVAASGVLAEQIRLDEQVLGIQVVDDDGTVVLASGHTSTVSQGPSPAAPLAPSSDQPTHATRVPLPATATAAHVDVLQDQSAALIAAADLTQRLDLLLLAGLATLWGLLLPVASRLGARLQAHTTQLETQHEELQRLLDREQQTITRLEELNRLKDGFLTAVSHELRTPLTIVTGTILTLRQHGPSLSPERRADLLDRAVRSARKLEELLSGLLELNRPGSRPVPGALDQVDLRALVTEAAAHLPPTPLDVDLEVRRVPGDRLQLERVLANLIGNAIRHAPGGAPISVRSRQVDQAVEITVSDRGPGVPNDLKQAVFEPFRQGTLKDEHSPGTGIGLALVARFVETHGGCTWVSDRAGGGATFHVRLPVRPAGPRDAALPDVADGGSARPGSPGPAHHGHQADMTSTSEVVTGSV